MHGARNAKCKTAGHVDTDRKYWLVGGYHAPFSRGQAGVFSELVAPFKKTISGRTLCQNIRMQPSGMSAKVHPEFKL